MTADRGQLLRIRRSPARFDELSDEGLIAACATEDRAARALLFERHVDAVHRFVRRMRCSDPDTVEDLVQATFLAAFQAASQFAGGHVRGWLFGIASNTVRNFARTEIRRKRALTVVADVQRLQPHHAQDAVLTSRLSDAIAALPHDLRAALVLVDLEGERGADAAAALEIPAGTLWRRLFEARQSLRAALGGEP